MLKILPIIIVGISISISLLLFWSMQAMIMYNQREYKTPPKLSMLEFVRLKRENKNPLKRIPPKPKPPKKRPPPKDIMQNTVASSTPDIAMPNIDIPMQHIRFDSSLVGGLEVRAGIDTDIVPLVKILPRYPMRAKSRGINEGWVKVRFIIAKNGLVKNPVVVSSKPKGIFDRAALRAIAKWKFQAKIIDGVPFEQHASQIVKFSLSK